MSEDIEKTDCEVFMVDEQKVDEARNSFPNSRDIKKIADMFKILSDPNRLRIVMALDSRELCVCDLAALLDMSSSAVSHQLRTLKNLNIVNHRKEGKMAYYTIADNGFAAFVHNSIENLSHEIG